MVLDTISILLQQWCYRYPLYPAACCSSGVRYHLYPGTAVVLQILSLSYCSSVVTDTLKILLQQWCYRNPLYPATAVVLKKPSISCCSSGVTDTLYILLQQWCYRYLLYPAAWCSSGVTYTLYILLQQWCYIYPLYPGAAVVL